MQTVLDLPSDLALWQSSASVSDTAARWRMYLHQLGKRALLEWCQEEWCQKEWRQEEMLNPSSQRGETAQLWPTEAPLDIWHVVDGLVLTLGQRRIVVMLSEAIDTAEISVPQEWVDLPGWAGDYYLAAYVEADEQQLTLWGYTTYHQLKTNGRYDADDRTYCLSDDELIQDFSAFWVAQQLESLASVSIQALPQVAPVQLNNLVERLARSLDPRLEIPFELWGALLSNAEARSQLYQQRLKYSQQASAKSENASAAVNSAVNLGAWANQVLSQGWESLESLLSRSLAVSMRTASQPVSPESTNRATTRGKAISLGTRDETVDLVLALALTLEPDERRNIRIRLYPASSEVDSCLPEGLSLTLLLTDTEEVLQEVQTGDCDNYIQLPPFRCPANQPFSIRIQQAGRSVQEDFIS